MSAGFASSLLRYMADALIGLDRSGTVVIWAGSAEAMFGYSQAEALGCNFALLVLPQGAEGHHDVLRSVIDSDARRRMSWCGGARTGP